MTADNGNEMARKPGGLHFSRMRNETGSSKGKLEYCMSQGQEVPGQRQLCGYMSVCRTLRKTHWFSLPFLPSADLCSHYDCQPRVHSGKRHRLLRWMKSCFAHLHSVPLRNQSKSNFRFLWTSLTLTWQRRCSGPGPITSCIIAKISNESTALWPSFD